MKTQSKPGIFFDQNIMEKMSKKRNLAFQNNVDNLIREIGQNTMQRLTPFGLLEFAGLNKTEIFDIDHKGKKLNEYPFCSYQEIESFIFEKKQHPGGKFKAEQDTLREKITQKISREILIEKLKEKKNKDQKYLNPRGLSLLQEYIKALNTKPDANSKNKHIYYSIIDNLFWDRLSQINISKLSAEDKKKFVIECIRLIIAILHHNLAMGSFRLVCRVSQEIRKDPEQKQLLKSNPHWRNIILKIDKICENLKPSGDLVDCELIHLAFFGKNNSWLHCFTTDNEKDIIDRLDFYCFYINFLIWLFWDCPQYEGNNIAQEYKQPPIWRCGKVFILNKETGEKITKISVKKIYEKQPKSF